MNDWDLIIIGGGLAGGLLAYRCHQMAPDLRLLLIERGDCLGGNHTWSFHGSDISVASLEWLAPFLGGAWETQSVRFPEYQRTLAAPYYSISSVRFDSVVRRALGENLWLEAEAVSLSPTLVNVEGRGVLRAKRVLDARGIAAPSGGSFGFQKFLGQDLLLKNDHGLAGPVIMDATVPQKEGFRFFYALPWGPRRLLLEDTRYSDTPQVDAVAYRREIERYADLRGWEIESVEREESGSLPIPMARQMPWMPSRDTIGVRAGLFHPTTGYSLPDAVQTAELFARQASRGIFWSSRKWNRHWKGEIRRRWFYRFLNRMLFAAPLDRRYTLLQRFYRLPEATLARFYACRLTRADALRILFWGRPPLPLSRALHAFFEPKESHVGI